MDAGKLIAMIVVASFVIDRIAAATFFLLSFSKTWDDWFPDPRFIGDERAKATAERRLKLVYYCFVGLLALVITSAWHMRILSQLEIPAGGDGVDWLFTAIVLTGGSGQIAELLRAPHTGKLPTPAAPEPLKINGSITLHEAATEATRRRE
jgi:hypothetical protein